MPELGKRKTPARSPANDSPALVPAVERACRIMDLVAKTPQGLTASELARQMGIAKSSAHTLCATLSQLNLLIRRTDQSFHLGPHIMRWANAFSERSDVAKEFVTIWDESTQFPGATITLSVLDGTEVVYIAARNSHALPNFEFRAGMRLPAAFTATGKAFLSTMSDLEVKRLFGSDFPMPLTERSPKTLAQLLKDVEACRKRGYSIDDEGVKEGMVCFGYPVLNSWNRPIAGLAVSLPKRIFDDREIAEIISNVSEIAQKISSRLGADV
jgi:DNA-binding IclR family transcriptional regulator